MSANPKDAYGAMKPSLSCIPTPALIRLGQAMENGAAKYGRLNWRENEVRASVYYDAALRHLMAWWDGEDADEESGLPHIAHVMACCAILIDATEVSALRDDRPRPGVTADMIRRLAGSASPDRLASMAKSLTDPRHDDGA